MEINDIKLIFYYEFNACFKTKNSLYKLNLENPKKNSVWRLWTLSIQFSTVSTHLIFIMVSLNMQDIAII